MLHVQEPPGTTLRRARGHFRGLKIRRYMKNGLVPVGIISILRADNVMYVLCKHVCNTCKIEGLQVNKKYFSITP